MRGERVGHGLGEGAELAGVQQGDALHGVAEDPGQPRGQTVADHHVVRRRPADVQHGVLGGGGAAGGLVSGGHDRASRISAATSSALLSSVSTLTVATDS